MLSAFNTDNGVKKSTGNRWQLIAIQVPLTTLTTLTYYYTYPLDFEANICKFQSIKM